MTNNGSSTPRLVPGTQLCHRALYATIVGEQPQDCLPGTSVKMSTEGPILLDHIFRVGRRYVPGEGAGAGAGASALAALTGGAVDNTGVVRALEELRRENLQCRRELEARTQQLDQRKQEVQMLQNKLRIVHVEAKKRGYNFHDLSGGGRSNDSSSKRSYDSDRHYGGRDSTPPRSSRSERGGSYNNSSSGSGAGSEYIRPPLPPLRVEGNMPCNLSSQPSLAAAISANNNNNNNNNYYNDPMAPPPLPPLFQQVSSTQNVMKPVLDVPANAGSILAQTSASSSSSAIISKETNNELSFNTSIKELDVIEKVVGVNQPLERQEEKVEVFNASNNSHSNSTSRKNNGVTVTVLPQHIVNANPGAMLFCRHCRLFLPPHPVSVANHLQSEGHQSSSGSSSNTTGPTYTQFGKLVQRMPSFIEAVTVVSEEQKRRETTEGNSFFETGFDIVHSTCALCRENVTTQSYKVHESLATHRRRAAEVKENEENNRGNKEKSEEDYDDNNNNNSN